MTTNTNGKNCGSQATVSSSPKGETKVSYTETTYHIAPSLVDDLTTSIQKAYGELRTGVLCRNFAAYVPWPVMGADGQGIG